MSVKSSANSNIVFRCDDVSINTDLNKLQSMRELLRKFYGNAKIIYGISPLVHNMQEETGLARERIFPKLLNAYSDFRVFYNVDMAGIPQIHDKTVNLAAHGLIHVDHRLLDRASKEMSILVSASLTKSNIFIPPFNKWDKEMEEICEEAGIELIKWETGWTHLKYHKVNPEWRSHYYFHTHDFSLDEFEQALCQPR